MATQELSSMVSTGPQGIGSHLIFLSPRSPPLFLKYSISMLLPSFVFLDLQLKRRSLKYGRKSWLSVYVAA